MPQIPVYDQSATPEGPLAPPGRRPSDGAQSIAAGLQSIGKGIADGGAAYEAVQKANAQQDVGQAQTKLSNVYAKYANDWSDTIAKADPNDQNVAKNFIQKFDDETSDLDSDIKTPEGQSFYDQNLSKLRSKLQDTAINGQSELHRVATMQNYTTSLDSSASALINDPTSFDAVKQLHDSALDQFVNSGALDRESALKLQTSGDTHLAQSAVRGWIQNSPEDAKALLDNGEYDKYLSGQMKHQLYGEVQSMENVKRVKQMQVQSDQDRAKRLAAESDYTKMLDLSTQNKLGVDDVLQSSMTGPQKRTFINSIQRGMQAPNSLVTDPDKFHDLFNRITNVPDNDPTKITDPSQLDAEFNNGGLSYADLNHLRTELSAGKTDHGKQEQIQKNSALNMMKQTIYRSAGSQDSSAPEMYMRAQQAYNTAWENGIKNGKTPADLTNPDFVKSVMKPFVPTTQSKVQQQAQQYQALKKTIPGNKPQDVQSHIAEILKRKGLAP